LEIASTDRVLVRGAGGGIGLFATQFAALATEHVTATTSSTDRGKRLLELGASTLWNRHIDGDLADDAYDVIIDTVAGADLPIFLGKLRANGRYLVCGGLGGRPPADFGMTIMANVHKSPTFFVLSLNSAPKTVLAREGAQIFEQATAGTIKPVIAEILPLEEASQAHRKLEERVVFGKLVLVPNPNRVTFDV